MNDQLDSEIRAFLAKVHDATSLPPPPAEVVVTRSVSRADDRRALLLVTALVAAVITLAGLTLVVRHRPAPNGPNAPTAVSSTVLGVPTSGGVPTPSSVAPAPVQSATTGEPTTAATTIVIAAPQAPTAAEPAPGSCAAAVRSRPPTPESTTSIPGDRPEVALVVPGWLPDGFVPVVPGFADWSPFAVPPPVVLLQRHGQDGASTIVQLSAPSLATAMPSDASAMSDGLIGWTCHESGAASQLLAEVTTASGIIRIRAWADTLTGGDLAQLAEAVLSKDLTWASGGPPASFSELWRSTAPTFMVGQNFELPNTRALIGIGAANGPVVGNDGAVASIETFILDGTPVTMFVGFGDRPAFAVVYPRPDGTFVVLNTNGVRSDDVTHVLTSLRPATIAERAAFDKAVGTPTS